jgi:hypothetical protein
MLARVKARIMLAQPCGIREGFGQRTDDCVLHRPFTSPHSIVPAGRWHHAHSRIAVLSAAAKLMPRRFTAR